MPLHLRENHTLSLFLCDFIVAAGGHVVLKSTQVDLHLRETHTLSLFLCDVIVAVGGHVVLKSTHSTAVFVALNGNLTTAILIL